MSDLTLSGSRDQLAASFLGVRSKADLAALLNIRTDQLDRYTYGRGQSYRAFQIRKRNGGSRSILEPAAGLKALQKKLSQVLTSVYRPRECVHGFVEGRSIATNALEHVGRDWVLNVDIQDFFSSINFGRVRGLFIAKPYGLPPSIATIVAKICTFQNQLPQGAPTSPVVSNMIAAKLDSQLSGLARRYRCTYTRFVDDMTFSRDGRNFPAALGQVASGREEGRGSIVGFKLRDVIESNGFQVNEMKVRLQCASERQIVTGLKVNEFVNVPRKFHRRIRAMLYAWRIHGHDKAQTEHFKCYDDKDRPHELPEFRQIVKGHIDFLAMVRGFDHPWYQEYIRQYAALDPDYELRSATQRRPNHLRTWRDGIWVIEAGLQQGTAFELEGYGLVTCAHVLDGDCNDIVIYHPRNEDLKYEARISRLAEQPKDLAVLESDAPSGYAFRAGRTSEAMVGASITVAGYPQHARGASLWEQSGEITAVRQFERVPRYIVSMSIVGGASGAPIFDKSRRVVGVASTGAETFAKSSAKAFGASEVGDYGVIPISVLETLFQGE